MKTVLGGLALESDWMRGGLTDWGLVLAVEEESQLNRLEAFIRKLRGCLKLELFLTCTPCLAWVCRLVCLMRAESNSACSSGMSRQSWMAF
jgi:hypothetical protein